VEIILADTEDMGGLLKGEEETTEFVYAIKINRLNITFVLSKWNTKWCISRDRLSLKTRNERRSMTQIVQKRTMEKKCRWVWTHEVSNAMPANYCASD
jgi:hypothetical protein